MNGLAEGRARKARVVTPIEWPPASRAPRAEASMTPPYPPFTTAIPAIARSRPTS